MINPQTFRILLFRGKFHVKKCGSLVKFPMSVTLCEKDLDSKNTKNVKETDESVGCWPTFVARFFESSPRIGKCAL